MKDSERWTWAAVIVLVDILFVAIPLTAFAAAYVLIARPVWFKDFVGRIYQAN